MSVIKVKGSLLKNTPAGLDDSKGCNFKDKWVRALFPDHSVCCCLIMCQCVDH